MQHVVLVHGIWMPRASMRVLAGRLASAGFLTHLYGYASVRGSADENAALLADFIDDGSLHGAHLVGHSLGGIVALRMLRNHEAVRVGRVVCLGSPLGGSRAGARLASVAWGRLMTGKTLADGVLTELPRSWAAPVVRRVAVGSIAGTVAVGAGRLLTTFAGDNDGTVAVAETRMNGLSDHLCLPVNHSGLVLSEAVARHVAGFLEHGAFG